MTHFATPQFWFHYRKIPAEIQNLADKNFTILKDDSNHPSLRLKKVGVYWSVGVGLHYRALAKERPEGLLWFWIGHHGDYDTILG